MANHRAPRRSASRTGTTDGTNLGAAPEAAPASVPGKRKAVKPSRAARTLPRRAQTPAPAPSPAAAARVETPAPAPAAARIQTPAPAAARVQTPAPTPAPAPTRAKTPAPAPSPAAAARAKTPAPARAAARRQNAPRKNVFPLLPSAPTAVGAAALVIAAAGAVTVTDSSPEIAAADNTRMFTPASAFTGTTAATSSLEIDDRMQAVSRDTQRAAIEDAADQDLQEAVEAQAEERNAALAQLAASAEKYAGQIAANAWRLPLAGYRLTARFGYSSSLWSSTHTGLDFAAPYGTPVVAVANGTVTSTSYDGAYGNKIVLELEDGTEIWYCHLSSFSVSPGETVTGGEQLGAVGSTGNSTGDHLHLEVRPGAGDPVDPYAALLAHGLTP